MGVGDHVLIPGFVFSGSEPKEFLIRAVGPGLEGLLDGFVADPMLTLFQQGTATPIGSNDQWWEAANAAAVETLTNQLGALPLETGSADAALLVTLAPHPSGYTFHVSGVDGGTGVALAEVYELDGDSTPQRLRNVSTRAFVSTGAAVTIPGFIVTGSGPATLLIRGVGPALAGLVPPPLMTDPVLGLHQQSDGRLLLENDDWSTAANGDRVADVAAAASAFSLPAGSADAALLVVVMPGAYTAIVSGKDGTTGIALAEVFEVDGLP